MVDKFTRQEIALAERAQVAALIEGMFSIGAALGRSLQAGTADAIQSLRECATNKSAKDKDRIASSKALLECSLSVHKLALGNHSVPDILDEVEKIVGGDVKKMVEANVEELAEDPGKLAELLERHAGPNDSGGIPKSH